MGITERKERDKQEMRKNIIDAAMQMFTHDGYENASIRKIADKIEYSPATIYLYYKDKDELLYDVQAECFSMLVAIFKKEATAADPFERLEQICRSYTEFGLKNPEIYDLMFIMRSPMNKVEEHEDWQNANDAFGILATCIHECVEKSLIRFDDVMTAALTIWSMGHGLVSLNNRCRMKVMHLSEEQIVQSIYAAMDNFLKNLIKK